MKRDGVLNHMNKAMFDVERYRKDFPILEQKIYRKPLIYLDNAATTQKPQVVIDALSRYYAQENANIHRGVYFLSEQATNAYEKVREKCRHFINAHSHKEIVFVRGTTEGINLIAQSYGRTFLKAGDEILITTLEHHSNIVPWQILCQQTSARLKIAPINDQGELILDEFSKLITSKTKFISVSHVSNVLGTINPVKQMVQLAHQHGIPVLIDGAQATPHMKVDVQELDSDFYVFSSHKLFGPTGVGVVYGKAELLEKMPPYQTGGDMISSVTFEKTTYNTVPYKFEAGTPNIADVIAFGSALDYISLIRLEKITSYESELLRYATEALSKLPGLRIIGTAKYKASVISFVLGSIHPHDIGTILDREGIAIRAGHHCAMPLMERFKVPATARASFAFYNTKEEVDRLVDGIHTVLEVFQS